MCNLHCKLYALHPVGGVSGSMQTDPGGLKPLFSTYFSILNKVKEGHDTCQLLTGRFPVDKL